MQQELLELCNEEGEFLGKTILRGQKVKEGEFVKLVLVLIENNNKQFLIQKTSKDRGSVYAFTGGHVKSGQSCEEVCVCEVEEELGFKVEKNDLDFVDKFCYNNRLFYVYHVRKDMPLEKIHIQYSEVESVEWLDESQIKKLSGENKLRESSHKAFMHLKSNLKSEKRKA